MEKANTDRRNKDHSVSSNRPDLLLVARVLIDPFSKNPEGANAVGIEAFAGVNDVAEFNGCD